MKSQSLEHGEKRHRMRKLRAMEQDSSLEKLQSGLKLGMTLVNNAQDSWAILLEDASDPGKFRYQCFDASGFCSHHTRNSLKEALNDAFVSGYRYQVEGVLDRISNTEEWVLGMAAEAACNEKNL